MSTGLMDAYAIIIIVACVPLGLLYWIFYEMSHPRYRCDHPYCDREFFDEESALGHAADMARHKPKRVD